MTTTQQYRILFRRADGQLESRDVTAPTADDAIAAIGADVGAAGFWIVAVDILDSAGGWAPVVDYQPDQRSAAAAFRLDQQLRGGVPDEAEPRYDDGAWTCAPGEGDIAREMIVDLTHAWPGTAHQLSRACGLPRGELFDVITGRRALTRAGMVRMAHAMRTAATHLRDAADVLTTDCPGCRATLRGTPDDWSRLAAATRVCPDHAGQVPGIEARANAAGNRADARDGSLDDVHPAAEHMAG